MARTAQRTPPKRASPSEPSLNVKSRRPPSPIRNGPPFISGFKPCERGNFGHVLQSFENRSIRNPPDNVLMTDLPTLFSQRISFSLQALPAIFAWQRVSGLFSFRTSRIFILAQAFVIRPTVFGYRNENFST